MAVRLSCQLENGNPRAAPALGVVLPVSWNDRETLFEFCCPESGAVISALVPDTVAHVAIGVDVTDEIGLSIGFQAGGNLRQPVTGHAVYARRK